MRTIFKYLNDLREKSTTLSSRYHQFEYFCPAHTRLLALNVFSGFAYGAFLDLSTDWVQKRHSHLKLSENCLSYSKGFAPTSCVEMILEKVKCSGRNCVGELYRVALTFC
jgi:hypothetical protein